MKLPEGLVRFDRNRAGAYWPIAVVVALLLIAAFVLPGAPNVRTADQLSAEEGNDAQDAVGSGPSTTAGPVVEAGRLAAGGPAAVNGPGAQQAGELPPDCDPATGRLKIPIVDAPLCKPLFNGDNGGSTYQGVTKDEIVIAYYVPLPNESVNAIIEAAGATDSPEETEAMIATYIDAFQKHFEMYGRKVKWVRVDGTGDSEDDQAAKADAIKVAEEIKAFASVGAANNTYVDELVARGVMCFCTAQLPIKFYKRWAPYVYGALPIYEQMATHLAEFVSKRLKGRPARWAGSSAMRSQPRRYGLVAFNTVNGDYSEGAKFMQDEMARRGVPIAQTVEFTFDLARAQEQARTMIAKLKDKGVTSVILALDPLYPIFITQEATRQRYFPEWIITGTALTDTNFFGRTYDQTQWAHAFGISPLAARLPLEQTDAWNFYKWHAGKEPTATAGLQIAYAALLGLFSGIHYAGPNLTPQSWQAGLFSLPLRKSAAAGGTSVLVSLGRHVWPYDDYAGIDDMTEIWWDPNAEGRDEIGQQGRGMIRFASGGRRYLPGQWPTAEASAFNPQGSVTLYDQRPAEDKPPDYPHPGEHIRE